MNIDASGSGIPALSPGECAALLSTLYASADAAGQPFSQVPAVFLWGRPGIGKSQAVRQAASKLEAASGKTVQVTDVRLLLFSPVDLRGIPVADGQAQAARWLKPQIFDLDPDPGIIHLLLLDELSAAPQSMQAAAYQICLDRRIGEHLLPDNCLVLAAGNRTTDRSIAYQMPKALCSRMMHFLIEPDFSGWRKWALDNGIDARIVGYLEKNPDRLCLEPEVKDIAYPSPRTWQFASQILQTMDQPLKNQLPLLAGCVGMDAALELVQYGEVFSTLPSVHEILQGRKPAYPKTADALFALCSALRYTLLQQNRSITDTELEHALSYALKFPADYAASLIQDLQADDLLSLKLMKSASLRQWLKKHPAYRPLNGSANRDDKS